MRKTVAKRIHKYIADQGITDAQLKRVATKACKRGWNSTPRNQRHQLAQALA